MASYQFDGIFRDTSWTKLPSPENVEASVKRAIRGATPQVFKIEISRTDVTSFNADVPAAIGIGWPRAYILVNWTVPDGN